MKDPICNMNVAEDSRFRSSHGGRTYVFCSAACKVKFDSEPDRYAKR